MDDPFLAAVQLPEALGQLRQWNERAAGDPAKLVLLRVAHVEDEDALAPVEASLEFLDRRVRCVGRGWRGCLLAAHAAKCLVIDEARDRRLVATHRTLRIAPHLELAEGHLQSIVQEQSADERLALAED